MVKSFKRYIKERAYGGVSPGDEYGIDSDTGTATGDVTNPEYNFDLSAKTDFENNNIYNVKSEIKKWFGKFNIFGLYKQEYYNKKEDFQFKVGIGVKL